MQKLAKILGLIRTKRITKLNLRAIELISIPAIILGAVVMRMFMSFTSVFRAALLSWGMMDGFVSNYLYKDEKFFPYQFIRYVRIVANMSGVVNPIIPIVWNIGDGAFSVFMYKTHRMFEHLPRYGRIVNGGLLAAFA